MTDRPISLPPGWTTTPLPPGYHRPDGEPFRVRVEDLRLPANVTAGMNALRLCALAYRLRGTTDDPEPPIAVTPEADGTWRISAARHRYLAAVVAGRPDVWCVAKQ